MMQSNTIRRPAVASRVRSIDSEASVASDTSNSLGVMLQIPSAFLRPSNASSSSAPYSISDVRRPFYAIGTEAAAPPSTSRCYREEARINRLVVQAKAQQQRSLHAQSLLPMTTHNRPPVYDLQHVSTLMTEPTESTSCAFSQPPLRIRIQNGSIRVTAPFDKEVPPPSPSSSRSFLYQSPGFLARRFFLSKAASGSFMEAILKEESETSSQTVVTTVSSSQSLSGGDSSSPRSLFSSKSDAASETTSGNVYVSTASSSPSLSARDGSPTSTLPPTIPKAQLSRSLSSPESAFSAYSPPTSPTHSSTKPSMLRGEYVPQLQLPQLQLQLQKPHRRKSLQSSSLSSSTKNPRRLVQWVKKQLRPSTMAEI